MAIVLMAWQKGALPYAAAASIPFAGHGQEFAGAI